MRTIFQYFLFLLILFSNYSSAQNTNIGKQIAQDEMAIVGYLELSNIGSRDRNCPIKTFDTTDVNYVIDNELKNNIIKLGEIDKKAINTSEINDIINLLKQIPLQKLNDKLVLVNVYEQKKQEADVAYGKDKSCMVLSAMFRTVIQQRRLSIKTLLYSK